MILRVTFMDDTWNKGVKRVWCGRESIFTYELVCLSLLGSNATWASDAREHLELLWYEMFLLFQQTSLFKFCQTTDRHSGQFSVPFCRDICPQSMYGRKQNEIAKHYKCGMIEKSLGKSIPSEKVRTKEKKNQTLITRIRLLFAKLADLT